MDGLGFRGGSEEKLMRMWLRRETVVTGLPSLVNIILIQAQAYEAGISEIYDFQALMNFTLLNLSYPEYVKNLALQAMQEGRVLSENC